MTADDYKSVFETLALDDSTLALGHSETITPTLQSRSPSAVDPMQTLPEFRMEESLGLDPDYRIVDRLGEGGMGVVSLAEQTALRRMVAVKEPKGVDARTHGRVLEEAFIMGRMEHPNVVPAYGLGRRPNGQPILVMKRVEGTSWEDVLTGRATAPGDGDADLVWHLRVLLQVCNALRFAHARQVVHRDIKPENVMIGDFGEVYLLDWGIALSLNPDSAEGFPTTKTSRGLAGTPAFMAPEMTHDDASDIDERTDVYLLGATLQLILTGEPPHAGKSLFEVCFSAYKSEPFDFDDDVPSDLAEIAHRAMAREKEDRYESVTAFAAALDDYLEHRASYMLSDAADDLLQRALAASDDEDTTSQILEAEFGFRQALTIWASNAGAQAGVQSAIEARARACIAREEVGGARAALDQLPRPNEEIEAALVTLQDELAARAERVDYLERFEYELDLKTGTRSRQRAVIVLGIGFTGLCFWQAWVARPGQPLSDGTDLLSSYWRLVAIAAIATTLFWRKLFGNLANRRLMAFFFSPLLYMLLLRFAAVNLGASPLYVQVAEIAVIGMATFAIGASTSRRLAALALLAYGAAGIVGVVTAQMWAALLALAVAHGAFFVFTAWLWRPSLTRDT